MARGFAPSTRLAVWSNHKFFLEVFNVVRKRLKAHQPRVAMDDIGITAIDASERQLEDLYQEVALIAEKHRLPLNHDKTLLRGAKGYQESAGMALNKETSSAGRRVILKEKN